MACGCQKKIEEPETALTVSALDLPDYSKLPTEHCAMCAEKHFATAYALMCETGYEQKNRDSAIDELICAIWHLSTIDKEIAISIRDIKHAVMLGKNPLTDTWMSIAETLNTLVSELFTVHSTIPVDVLYRTIGELVCCAWHTHKAGDETTATAVRNIRHKIQQRIIPSAGEWRDICSMLKTALDTELKEKQQ